MGCPLQDGFSLILQAIKAHHEESLIYQIGILLGAKTDLKSAQKEQKTELQILDEVKELINSTKGAWQSGSI